MITSLKKAIEMIAASCRVRITDPDTYGSYSAGEHLWLFLLVATVVVAGFLVWKRA